jgi:hypothetical protein
VDELAAPVARRLAGEWERHAEQLRYSKQAIDSLSSRLREALIEPGPIEGAEEHAKLFDEAAAQLRNAAGTGPERTAR